MRLTLVLCLMAGPCAMGAVQYAFPAWPYPYAGQYLQYAYPAQYYYPAAQLQMNMPMQNTVPSWQPVYAPQPAAYPSMMYARPVAAAVPTRPAEGDEFTPPMPTIPELNFDGDTPLPDTAAEKYFKKTKDRFGLDTIKLDPPYDQITTKARENGEKAGYIQGYQEGYYNIEPNSKNLGDSSVFQQEHETYRRGKAMVARADQLSANQYTAAFLSPGTDLSDPAKKAPAPAAESSIKPVAAETPKQPLGWQERSSVPKTGTLNLFGFQVPSTMPDPTAPISSERIPAAEVAGAEAEIKGQQKPDGVELPMSDSSFWK